MRFKQFTGRFPVGQIKLFSKVSIKTKSGEIHFGDSQGTTAIPFKITMTGILKASEGFFKKGRCMDQHCDQFSKWSEMGSYSIELYDFNKTKILAMLSFNYNERLSITDDQSIGIFESILPGGGKKIYECRP